MIKTTPPVSATKTSATHSSAHRNEPGTSASAKGSNILVAMPKPDTLPPKTQSLEQRIAFVEECIASSQHMFNKLEKGNKPQQKIYVGPEYMFDKETASQGKKDHKQHDTIRQLTEAEYRQVDTAMRALSKKYPDIVIKPGTVSWQKPVLRPTTLEGYLAAKGASSPSHPLHNEYKRKFLEKNTANELATPSSRLNKAIAANKQAQEIYGKHNAPDISDDITHLARNTSDTYLNGKRISHHHKITDFHEVNGMRPGENVQHYAGKDALGKHRLPDGSTATQEICLDHALDATKKAGTAHFIQSDWAAPKHTLDKYQDNTAFIVHASTHDQVKNIKVQGVAKVGQNGQLSTLQPIAEKNGISVYDLQKSAVSSSEQLPPRTSNTNFDDLLKGMGKDAVEQIQQQPNDKGCVVS